jgi:hypothetical protein
VTIPHQLSAVADEGIPPIRIACPDFGKLIFKGPSDALTRLKEFIIQNSGKKSIQITEQKNEFTIHNLNPHFVVNLIKNPPKIQQQVSSTSKTITDGNAQSALPPRSVAPVAAVPAMTKLPVTIVESQPRPVAQVASAKAAPAPVPTLSAAPGLSVSVTTSPTPAAAPAPPAVTLPANLPPAAAVPIPAATPAPTTVASPAPSVALPKEAAKPKSALPQLPPPRPKYRLPMPTPNVTTPVSVMSPPRGYSPTHFKPAAAQTTPAAQGELTLPQTDHEAAQNEILSYLRNQLNRLRNLLGPTCSVVTIDSVFKFENQLREREGVNLLTFLCDVIAVLEESDKQKETLKELLGRVFSMNAQELLQHFRELQNNLLAGKISQNTVPAILARFNIQPRDDHTPIPTR